MNCKVKWSWKNVERIIIIIIIYKKMTEWGGQGVGKIRLL